MKKHSVLVSKILLGFIILAVLICAASTGIGYIQYKAYIQKQYNDMAYQIAEVIRDYLSGTELYRYIDMARQHKAGTISRKELEKEGRTSRYLQVEAQVKLLRENMGANDIYLAYLDIDELRGFNGDTENWNPMTYIFDTYIDQEQAFHFGDMGGLNPEFVSDALAVAETGRRSGNYFISKSAYGFNTSAILPIVEDGKTIAVIGVEIPMSTLLNTLRDYVWHAVLAMAVVTGLCLAVYMNYLLRSVIAPINVIAGEARRFVADENKISQKLSQIHTGDEIQTLSETLLKLEVDICQYIDNLTQVTAEKERIGAELNVATQIQADMLPSIFPAFPGRKEFDIFATMNPAKEVGGDFYDFFLVDEDHLALVVADVSGKGIPAALFMVIAKTLIKNQAQMGNSPKAVMEAVNNQLCENNEAEMFVTVWLGILEISTGILTAVNAGHEYPMMKQGGGAYELLNDSHGFVMGVMPGMEHEEYQIQMKPGDGIFVYSDGAPDAVNGQEDQFGRERLLEALNCRSNEMPMELLKHVKGDIDSFVGDAPQFDDITMLCLIYGGTC